jgi:Ala-tRNA(Pro) deacylase
MAIAISLRDFLGSHRLGYDIIPHKLAESGQRNASAAHLPGDKVAKAVLLKDDNGYLLAVMPATHRLHFGRLHKNLNRHFGLATEEEVIGLFRDCSPGAIPPAGLLYDVDTLVDDALLDQQDVYFEAGDHKHLLHMDRGDFGKLMGDATHTEFSYHT